LARQAQKQSTSMEEQASLRRATSDAEPHSARRTPMPVGASALRAVPGPSLGPVSPTQVARRAQPASLPGTARDTEEAIELEDAQLDAWTGAAVAAMEANDSHVSGMAPRPSVRETVEAGVRAADHLGSASGSQHLYSASSSPSPGPSAQVSCSVFCHALAPAQFPAPIP
jgi:hypothetical protein